MTDEEWMRIKTLAEAHCGERKDSRQIMASAVMRHEVDIEKLSQDMAALKECVARLITERDKENER